MNGFEFVPEMLIVVGAAAVGGLVGGLLSGRKSGLVGSILMGTIGGLVVALIAQAADFAPIVEAGGYSVVYAILGGVFLAGIIGFSSR